MLPHIEIAAEKLFYFLGMPVTNTLVMSVGAAGLLASLGIPLRKAGFIPGFLQNLIEIVTEKFLDLMQGMFGSREKAEKYFPLIATIFLFVLLSNWLGILPGVGSLGYYEMAHGKEKFVPFFRSAASDLNFTLALGIVAVLSVNIFGIAAIGFWKYAGKFFSLKSPLDFFVGALEFIAEIAKMVSFSFRLFGNVFAGEVLLIITAFLVPYLIPVPFLALELFVGFIQALVFAMLVMVFISIAVTRH